MKEKEIMQQLNKEIENVEVSDAVLTNVLMQMRREKAHNKSTVQGKKPWFSWTKRVRGAVAVFAVFAIMIISVPFLWQGDKDAPPSTSGPFSVRTYDNFETHIGIDEVDVVMGRNIPLPMQFIEYNLSEVKLIKSVDSSYNLVQLEYNDSINKAKSINLKAVCVYGENAPDYGVYPNATDIAGIVTHSKNASVTNKGSLTFKLEGIDYYIDYEQTDEKVLEKMIVAILGDVNKKEKNN